MQIVDRFDGPGVHISMPLKRQDLPWNVPNDEYMVTYLKTLVNYANDKRVKRGVFTLYDLCMDLNLEPKSIYAYIGWGKDDEIKMNPYIDDTKVMIGLDCKFL